MKAKKMFVVMSFVTVFTMLAADPTGVINGWDFRRSQSKGELTEAHAVVIKGSNIKHTDLNRFKSIKCKTGDTIGLKYAVDGNGEFTSGCHLYNKRNQWVGVVKGDIKTVDGKSIVEFSLVIPACKKGEVVACRPYISVGKNGIVTLDKFEYSINK